MSDSKGRGRFFGRPDVLLIDEQPAIQLPEVDLVDDFDTDPGIPISDEGDADDAARVFLGLPGNDAPMIEGELLPDAVSQIEEALGGGASTGRPMRLAVMTPTVTEGREDRGHVHRKEDLVEATLELPAAIERGVYSQDPAFNPPNRSKMRLDVARPEAPRRPVISEPPSERPTELEVDSFRRRDANRSRPPENSRRSLESRPPDSSRFSDSSRRSLDSRPPEPTRRQPPPPDDFRDKFSKSSMESSGPLPRIASVENTEEMQAPNVGWRPIAAVARKRDAAPEPEPSFLPPTPPATPEKGQEPSGVFPKLPPAEPAPATPVEAPGPVLSKGLVAFVAVVGLGLGGVAAWMGQTPKPVVETPPSAPAATDTVTSAVPPALPPRATGLLQVWSDQSAKVYVDGVLKGTVEGRGRDAGPRTGTSNLEPIPLSPGLHKVRAVATGGGRTRNMDVRIDENRPKDLVIHFMQ